MRVDQDLHFHGSRLSSKRVCPTHAALDCHCMVVTASNPARGRRSVPLPPIPCGSGFRENSARLKTSIWRPWPAKTRGFSLNIDQGRSLCVHHKDVSRFETVMKDGHECLLHYRQDSAWTATVHRGFQTHTLAASDYSLVKELKFYASDLQEVRKIFPVAFTSVSANGGGGY